MKPISFNLPFRAIPKGNKQKVAKRGAHGRMILGDLTGVLKKSQEEFGEMALRRMSEEERATFPWKCPMKAEVTFVYPVPVGWSQWKRDAALVEEEEGRYHYESTPDLENVVKFVFDALEKLVYDNDRRIWKQVLEKRYGLEERVIVTLTPYAQAAAAPKRRRKQTA